MADQMTSRDVAATAGATQSTVNRWVNQGLLKPCLIVPGYRGARLFDRAEVERFVQERGDARS